MVFHRSVDGMDIMLRIDNYQSPSEHEYGDRWCDCSFSFRFGEIINYHKDHDELLMPEEVDALADGLTDLLDGKITEPQERPMLEPDFVFMLYPAKDLRTDPTYTYIKPRDEFQDIYVEWRVFFWNDGLTENFLTITLEREDIASLRDFLNSCKNDAGKV